MARPDTWSGAGDLWSAVLAVPWVVDASVLSEVDSTNLEVRRRLDAGAPVSGLVVVAGRQTAGRGRRDRTWEDVEDGNLAISVAAPLPAAPGSVPLAAGLAVAATFDDLGLTTSCKWPNDVRVVVDGQPRKCAGILCEVVAEQSAVVIGIGIDVDWRGRRGEGEAAAWTSLAEALDRGVQPIEVVVGLLDHLGERLDQLARRSPAVLDDYRATCDTLGRRVRVEGERAELVGRATDLTPDGHLVVEVDGQEHVVSAGDVVHLRPA